MRKRLGNQNVRQVLANLLAEVFVCKQKKARVVTGGSLFNTELNK